MSERPGRVTLRFLRATIRRRKMDSTTLVRATVAGAVTAFVCLGCSSSSPSEDSTGVTSLASSGNGTCTVDLKGYPGYADGTYQICNGTDCNYSAGACSAV